MAGSVRKRTAAIVALAGLAVAATGTVVALQVPGASASSSPSAATPEPLSATSPPPSTRVAGWRLLSTTADGTELTIAVHMGGSCEKFDHIDVTESDSSVTVTPILDVEPDAACADSLIMVEEKVVLHSPVGTRDVIHGETLP